MFRQPVHRLAVRSPFQSSKVLKNPRYKRISLMKFLALSRPVGIVTVGVVLLVATTIFAQQFGGAQVSEQATVKLVSEMISKYHITQKPLDDRISAMVLNKFIKDLDSQKLYFLKSDIDGFARYRDQLDDLLKVGQVNFAHEVFKVYLQRLDERMVVAHMMIDAPHNFALDESMMVDGDQLSWSVDVKELNERWRKRVKYELLSMHLDKTSPEDSRKRLHKRYETLKRNAHDTEDNEVLEMFLSSVAHCFDPHSSYMSPQTVEDFQITMRLSLQGIGAALKQTSGHLAVSWLR